MPEDLCSKLLFQQNKIKGDLFFFPTSAPTNSQELGGNGKEKQREAVTGGALQVNDRALQPMGVSPG